MVEGLMWAIRLHHPLLTEMLTTACWMDCLPGGCGVHTPQLGLSSVLGYEFMSQSALAAFVCHSRHDLSHGRWIPFMCPLSTYLEFLGSVASLKRVAKRSVLACNREQRYKSPSTWSLIDMISKLHINEPNEVQIERNYIPSDNVMKQCFYGTKFMKRYKLFLCISYSYWSYCDLLSNYVK